MPDSISHRRWQLDKARMAAQREAMRVYDAETYYPAMKAIQDECGALPGGHTEGHSHDNGLGWTWWYCGRCGAKHGEVSHRPVGMPHELGMGYDDAPATE